MGPRIITEHGFLEKSLEVNRKRRWRGEGVMAMKAVLRHQIAWNNFFESNTMRRFSSGQIGSRFAKLQLLHYYRAIHTPNTEIFFCFFFDMRCQCTHSPLGFLLWGLKVPPGPQTTHHTPLEGKLLLWGVVSAKVIHSFGVLFKLPLLDGSLVRETRCIVGARCFVSEIFDSWTRIVNSGSRCGVRWLLFQKRATSTMKAVVLENWTDSEKEVGSGQVGLNTLSWSQ